MMHKRLSFLLIAAAPSFTLADVLQGTVSRVSDGDTLQITSSANGKPSKPIKVRIQGIDAPEICQAGGKPSRDALKARLLRQSVTIRTQARDNFGRVIAQVEHAGQDIGAWQVSNGHAWSDAYRYNPGPYADEQNAAQKKALGLWAQRPAIEPKQWRKLYGTCHPSKFSL